MVVVVVGGGAGRDAGWAGPRGAVLRGHHQRSAPCRVPAVSHLGLPVQELCRLPLRGHHFLFKVISSTPSSTQDQAASSQTKLDVSLDPGESRMALISLAPHPRRLVGRKHLLGLCLCSGCHPS